ncbi:Peptidase M16 inactive domain protein [Gemmata obscuriglobus]|uniref:Insulinase family protein n=1 Tax=Gemmata obscuriglobus TaxID=114 RepID=A0A2Z3H082_9BACT|nr:pitrilysin family protein [Gemmata obscuriglobus]AWM37157.1 insulinase family protein [Gemmata obscuriglobus]QEG30109.1 Peptidase M16 inactive domain protein [Gemmata obscuriglobus]VTS09430.1 zn-dependent peptidase : Predicted Zn-dependent peptidases OS=bacterium UASB270 GN=U27_00685 PE=3 SV=1: Peptidase_M16: Peptidase_M16_C: Peptidase_M16: Peptidase_M16_C [Gemmata obscuriglobus UQM 2246]
MSRFALGLPPLLALSLLVPIAPTRGEPAANPPEQPVAARAADATSDAELVKTAQGMFADLKLVTLENGLRVYLLPVKGAPVVTTMVAYRVGAADEEKDQTGLSHYLEHLLFKGTAKLVPGDIDRATQRSGGRNNAYTSEDMTVYHFDFAADRWEIALEIEADRMRNTLIDAKHEFEQEKGAVVSELEGGEDNPWDLEYKAILPLLWPKESPYSHPVIGQREHVRGATAEVIKRHYDKWYHPNNASLIVAGGFDPDAALEKIKKLFGPIAKTELPPRKKATFYPERKEPVRKEFESKFDVPRMMVGFNTVQVGTPEDPVLDVVQEILAGGKTSRLYRKMVEDERIASEVSAGNYAGRYPGWFAVNVELLQGKDRKKAEELAFAELDKLAAEPVSDAELNRARRKILASFIFARESVHSLCDAVARTSTYPGGEDVAKFFKNYLDRVAKVTKEDIQKVAKQYLVRNTSAIVWSVPAAPPQKGGMQNPEFGTKTEQARALPRAPSHVAFRASHAAPKSAEAGTSGFSLNAAKKVVLPNGLTVVLLEDHRLPVVVAAAEVANVRLREPLEKLGVATLMGNLLEEGTAKHTGKEISALIEGTGGSLSLSSSGGTLKVLTPDTDLGLGLLFECLQAPTFPEDALERMREQQLSSIADAETQPRTRAGRLFNATVYGNHPSGRPALGKKEIVEKLTAADVKAFHKLAFAPNFATVAVVGDFKTDEMVKKLEALTSSWKKSELSQPEVAPPPEPKSGEQIVSDKNASQVHVYIGRLGITRDHPDYYKLLVMDNVLGTGPGFTDRLSSNLRDRLGLAYTVNATITTTAGKQPGTFTGFVGTFPNKFLDVKFGFFKEVNKLRDEVPTNQEVEDAKKYLLGSLPFKFTTLSGVAGELLAAERYGLGFDYLEKYRKEVAAVTPADVQAMAKKHLDPKTLVLVAVGAIDKDGKPLEKEKK